MISIDNAQNEIGLTGHIDDGREWADWLLKKANESAPITESSDYLMVPSSAALRKELEEINQQRIALKAEWRKKFDLLNLVYELEFYLLTERQA
ncbi:hypothetical protein [Xenorhabdus innexi]|uniref:Uncharacterized protein n=1 Tax=Xenorhabdus innexi TaxID=290109 RepID=A0A1N6N135_9GAMM|nr:hypothetical protein [Xenorhabdus innexi]PHM31336.1 hypothetical protein Xinn_02882 [Xenorhabdus innexi]SIP74787.1 hypothetical protein XIS1_840056 [Xenorhabdus innexi]